MWGASLMVASPVTLIEALVVVEPMAQPRVVLVPPVTTRLPPMASGLSVAAA